MSKHSFTAQGFTLIELIATMAITGTLLALAIPSFNSTITSSRLTSYANDLVSALNLARSEAVRGGSAVTVSHNGTPTHWESGWSVVDANGIILRVYTKLANGYTLTNNGLYKNAVTYLSSGLTSVAGTTPSEVVFNLCNGTDMTTSRAISIGSVGRSHISKVGSAVSCP
jgi:type IV fimbrial biogenesis protein FimT